MSEVSPGKEEFFKAMADQHLALTYDDVRLHTRSGQDIEPQEPSTSSQFSVNTGLQTPFVSAAMSDVTESGMAIAMAKAGGLGVIHASLSIDNQRRQVRAVKLELNGLIDSPITVKENQTVNEVLSQYSDKSFRTFPVINSNNTCVGIMTGNNFDFCQDRQTTVASNMTPISELVTAPKGTSIEEAHHIMWSNQKKTLPVVNEDGSLAGLYLWSDVNRILRNGSGNYNVDEDGRLRVAAAIPTSEEGLLRLEAMQKYLDVVVLDSADGDSYYAFETLKSIKNASFDVDVVVGNISNPESARQLVDAGADGIKVGQGPGSICSTRREMGIGMPQVTAVYECAKAIRGSGVPVCADGGIRYHGDIILAIAAGADSVMMGGMLAGTEEAPGEVIRKQDGTRVKRYRGMGSASALSESAAARQRYGDNTDEIPLPEGIESTVSLQGSALTVISDCIKALKKSMKYQKYYSIPDLQNHGQFVRITNAGLAESHPHSVNPIK